MDFAIFGALAVWRMTHLVHCEHGPWHLLTRFRQTVRRTALGGVVDCFSCLSLWIAAPFAAGLGRRWSERFLLWLAYSAAAILIERVTYREEAVQPPIWVEGEGGSDELLRRIAESAAATRRK